MAGENKTSNTAFEDMMLTLFAFLLVGQMLQNGPEIIGNKLGIDLGQNQYLVKHASLTKDTPLQTKVGTVSGADFFSSPGEEGDKAGSFLPGSSLILEEGPETIDGERRWKVTNTETGKSGWVKESSLIVEGVGGIGPATKLGTKARVLSDSGVWDAPGGMLKTGLLVTKGDWGELTKGPQTSNGSRWWFFDSDENDNDGWLPEVGLILASESGWQENSSVKGSRITDIFERAGGGRIIGLLAKDEKAKVLGGPVEVGGALWWLIVTEEDETGWVPEGALEDAGIKSFFKGMIATLMIIGTIITLLFLGGIVYVTIRTNQIRAREVKRIKSAIPKKTEQYHNERWEKVLEHVSSENPSDWRFAILEADVMLDELFTKMGYIGLTLGDKLKQANQGDVKSLDAAWEAHKTRNQIAHEGGDFILTQREARRVIELYAQVFRESRYI